MKRMYCSELTTNALRKAIEDYKKRKELKRRKDEERTWKIKMSDC